MSSPFRSLRLQLDVSIVLPLLDRLRAQAAAMGPDPSGELQTLLGLFAPDFPATRIITITAQEAPYVLRAGARLRLHLRATDFAAIPDAAFEQPDLWPEDRRTDPAVRCYLFLATLQETILENSVYVRPENPGRLNRWLDRIQDFYGTSLAARRSKARAAAAGSPAASSLWQVVVHNDPVNLMTYVNMVFQAELDLPETVARQRMQEVHEARRSLVWQGPQPQAQARARALRAWHLTATAEPVPLA